MNPATEPVDLDIETSKAAILRADLESARTAIGASIRALDEAVWLRAEVASQAAEIKRLNAENERLGRWITNNAPEAIDGASENVGAIATAIRLLEAASVGRGRESALLENVDSLRAELATARGTERGLIADELYAWANQADTPENRKLRRAALLIGPEPTEDEMRAGIAGLLEGMANRRG
jgi:hypothetical protein